MTTSYCTWRYVFYNNTTCLDDGPFADSDAGQNHYSITQPDIGLNKYISNDICVVVWDFLAMVVVILRDDFTTRTGVKIVTNNNASATTYLQSVEINVSPHMGIFCEHREAKTA